LRFSCSVSTRVTLERYFGRAREEEPSKPKRYSLRTFLNVSREEKSKSSETREREEEVGFLALLTFYTLAASTDKIRTHGSKRASQYHGWNDRRSDSTDLHPILPGTQPLKIQWKRSAGQTDFEAFNTWRWLLSKTTSIKNFKECQVILAEERRGAKLCAGAAKGRILYFLYYK
jgi:hypothetical protein